MDILKDIKINRELDEFIYVQLFHELSRMIDSGELRPYDKLPPIRTMSSLLDLNTVTVVNAYKMLEQAGLVHKKVGSGTYISPRIEDEDNTGEFDEGLINFTSTTPPNELFPVEDFKLSMNEVIDRDGGNAFGYHEGKGFKPLRENFRKQLRLYGIDVSVNEIQIISGVQQGIDIVSKAIINQGDVVVVEAPTYAGAIGSFRLRGANIVEISLEELQTFGPEELEEFIIQYKPKLFYTIPNFQNPSGNTYSKARKEHLVELSKEYNFYIIEDDFATDLAFNSMEPDCLKKFDHDDRVIYLKSFSKLFMPGLRIGYMIVPERLEELIIFAKHTSDISTSGFMQRAFENYLASGRFDRQFKHVYRTLKERFQCTYDYIETHGSELLQCQLPDGGVNFWFKLSDKIDHVLFFSRLEEKGIRIVKGESFFATRQDKEYFRLSVAGLETKEIEFGLELIYKTASKCQRPQSYRKKGFKD